MNDPKIRSSLKAQYLSQIKDCLMLNEVDIIRGKSRVDIVAITPTMLEAFEIKSGQDSLQRLPSQVKFYDQVFDLCSLITEPKYVDAAKEILTPHWGIIVVEETFDTIKFVYKRQPQLNPKVNPRKRIELLWRNETFSLLRHFGVFVSKNSSKIKLWDIVVERISSADQKQFIHYFLKNRTDWKTPIS